LDGSQHADLNGGFDDRKLCDQGINFCALLR
jgi:hypothetical protein